MNRKIGAVLGIAVVLMFGAMIVGTDWKEIDAGYGGDVPDEGIPFSPADENDNNCINSLLFEQYGAILLVLGILMFGAMIAGVCLSREEEDTDD